jgi:hypothetical protein
MASLLFLSVCVLAVVFFLFVLAHFMAEERHNHVSEPGAAVIDAATPAPVASASSRNVRVLQWQAAAKKRERSHAEVHLAR